MSTQVVIARSWLTAPGESVPWPKLCRRSEAGLFLGSVTGLRATGRYPSPSRSRPGSLGLPLGHGFQACCEPQTSLFSPSLLAGYLVFSWVKYSTVGILGENCEDLILFPRPPPRPQMDLTCSRKGSVG